MSAVPPVYGLALAVVLFALGLLGVLVRRTRETPGEAASPAGGHQP